MNPSYLSPSSSTFSSSSSLIDSNEDSMIRKQLLGQEPSSLSSVRLPQIDGDRKSVSTSSKFRNKDNSGRAFLSVRKSVGLLKSSSINDKIIASGNQRYIFGLGINDQI